MSLRGPRRQGQRLRRARACVRRALVRARGVSQHGRETGVAQTRPTLCRSASPHGTARASLACNAWSRTQRSAIDPSVRDRDSTGSANRPDGAILRSVVPIVCGHTFDYRSMWSGGLQPEGVEARSPRSATLHCSHICSSLRGLAECPQRIIRSVASSERPLSFAARPRSA
jgi:hypothetical protein